MDDAELVAVLENLIEDMTPVIEQMTLRGAAADEVQKVVDAQDAVLGFGVPIYQRTYDGDGNLKEGTGE
ncbi:MAG: hypothetical protein AAFN44_11510 [Pseudomonadota bacterium]